MADAEIIAAGSELLTSAKVDTNSLYLTGELNKLGVEVVRKAVVGDDRGMLADTIKAALARAQIVILTGGLGPTEDDVTRDAAAEALGVGQSFNQEAFGQLTERFNRAGRKMAENNKRQAMILEGAEILRNDWGTAPGQWIEHNGAVVILLPGPPRELEAIFARRCVPRLERLLPPQCICTRFFRVAGMGESDVDQLIAPVYTHYRNPVTTILAGPSDIQIHLRAHGGSLPEAEALLDEVAAQIEPLLGIRLYSRYGEPLEQVIGAMLLARGAHLSVAESATGGMLGSRITEIPGSASYFSGGFLVYNNEMKIKLLGVPEDLIRKHTEVSEPVAVAMAEGARRATGSEYALSITGYAGPEGEKVGLVFIGLATPDGAEARRVQFPGDRHRIRAFATNTALDMLRRKLL